ncbi:hypothetical protein ASG87_05100 [Frateuria sp. Soil773]|uniref:DUF418 domain-containing protein n=1 Tax=Frateuria sp. Soil773 TaxID=1736407 RepID=UPI0006FAAFEF|nr:DUF418 domain-containing protein [Frateuria sp. Soil773]KRE88939.1 hypothetical protein ASG87_05100 [Frateuria sp. Soil773]
MSNHSGPYSNARYSAPDVLRGFAMFGMLLMNIQGYALLSSEYVNPMAKGSLVGADWWAWAFTHVFTEQKFMTLFSLLFGAGVAIAAEHREARGQSPWGDFWTRSALLLVIGMAHAYLVWYGDVLTTYALAGVVAMLMRKRRVRTLMATGLLLLSLPSLYSLLLGFSFGGFPPDIKAELAQAWNPTVTAIAREQLAYRSGWLAQMPQRLHDAWTLQTFFMATLFFWRAAGLMLIGMALRQIGLLTGERPAATYSRLAMIGVPLGVAITVLGVLSNEAHHWEVSYSMFLGSQFNYWGSIVLAFGYLGLVYAMRQRNAFAGLIGVFAKAGRSTLTLYLLMSIVGTFVFYGHGLGYYDRLGRLTLLAMAPAFWLVELLVLGIWSRRFRSGPMEMLMAWVRDLVVPAPHASSPAVASAQLHIENICP